MDIIVSESFAVRSAHHQNKQKVWARHDIPNEAYRKLEHLYVSGRTK